MVSLSVHVKLHLSLRITQWNYPSLHIRQRWKGHGRREALQKGCYIEPIRPVDGLRPSRMHQGHAERRASACWGGYALMPLH